MTDDVTPEISEQEKALRDEIGKSERDMDGLERELTGVDNELEALSDKGRKFEVLGRLCGSLEELDNLGGIELFWDAAAGPRGPAQLLVGARRNIEAFAEELATRIVCEGQPARFIPSLDQIITTLEDEALPGDVLITMGAGDIDRVHHEFTGRLQRHYSAR